MMDQPQNVTLKDVYELVDSSRKETAQQLQEVNGDVVDVKVAVGKIETKMEAQDDKIDDGLGRIRTLEKKVQDQRIRAARLGGLAGLVATGALQALEWVLGRL